MEEIKDDKALYQAVTEYASKVWEWKGYTDDDFDGEPTPDEFIEILEERIKWLKEHKRVVDRYMRKRNGPTWFRVIEGRGPAT